MVHSALTVSSVDKVRRDCHNKPDEQESKASKPTSFSSIIKEKMEKQESVPRTCQIMTYGNDSMLHLFQYQSKEYHY